MISCAGGEVEDGGPAGGVKLDSGCLKPERPANGEMFVLWSGLLIQFRCRADFKLIGAGAIICRNRTWTQEPPLCQPSGLLLFESLFSSFLFKILWAILPNHRHGHQIGMSCCNIIFVGYRVGDLFEILCDSIGFLLGNFVTKYFDLWVLTFFTCLWDVKWLK